jgi:hypothetical protein
MSNDFMGGGTATSLKFENVGDSHKGTIVRIDSKNDKDITTGKVKTWDDGEPKKVYIWEIKQENGEVGAFWVRGHLVTVLREAAREAGAKSQADLIGADVWVQHSELGEAKKGMAAPKLYKAKIKLNKSATSEEFDPFA